ncbi:helix-turn-helix domain-containing protein [uncultured Trichococcus sp.]|uniref:helix-turn-helix domain-containing protein n=1 Tax=uncultured Trichococcus sp. TaxID=189665 RepID=UPI002A18AEF6|nr:helix-turn-helix domain-containing protein [uncultured Trichococcus sp.]
MKDLTYIEYLFLDCISTGRPIKEATLFYILIGKRTVSTMLQCRQYDLEAYFAVMPGMKPKVLKKGLDRLVSDGLVTGSDGEGHLLTEAGSRTKAAFSSKHARFSLANQMEYALVQGVLRRRLLFLIQILSEMLHKNKQYYPIEREAKEQIWMKRLLAQHSGNKASFARSYGKEWHTYLSRLPERDAGLFALQFEGNDHLRKTTGQMAGLLSLEEAEVRVLLRQIWLSLFDALENEPEKFPVLSSVMRMTINENGLASASAETTMRYFTQGHDLNEIISMRGLKQSTIQDHFAEIALIYPEFPTEKFMDQEKLQYLQQLVEQKARVDYREIQKAFPEINFFESRLIQIRSEVAVKHG